MARLTVSGLASRMAFSYDEIEDLRIAVGEVCGILFDPGSDPGDRSTSPGTTAPDAAGTESPDQSAPPTRSGQIEIVCTVSDEALHVRTTRSAGHSMLEVTDLNRQILESVTDMVEFDLDPGSPSVAFTKRRRI